MDQETLGTVVSVKKQWWLKVNTKSVRMGPSDGAAFPHIVKVKYTVNNQEYFKRKWIRALDTPPYAGTSVTVLYSKEDPKKAKII